MKPDLLTGKLVRLGAVDIEEMAEAVSKWSQDSEYWRLLDTGATQPYSPRQTRKWFEDMFTEDSPNNYYFAIRTFSGDHLIGDIGLDGIRWNQAETFVGIGIGERDYWGKGYGTDAMEIILRFAFNELNLARVSLDVFEFNPRAVRSYEKAGFTYEGRVRQYLNKAGKRWDLIYMGITREEWQSKSF